MQRVSAVRVLAAFAAISFLITIPACGGGNGTVNTTVTQLLLSPTTISLNQGAVGTLSVTAENSSGQVVPADISFSSSNSRIVTVSTGGLICGGVWDSSFINCNAVSGSAGVGQVTVTATATAFHVSATTTVYVHERVDQVKAVLGTSCTTMSDNVSISGQAFSTSAPGCSPAAPCNITSTVGPFAFGSNDLSIAAVNATTGDLVAGTPGATTVFASVSGVNSVGAPYQTCAVQYIKVRSVSNSNVTSFTLGTGDTQQLSADVFDTASRYVKPVLTWGTSSSATATIAASGSGNNPGTITAVAPGTAYITASCSYPNCNKGVPAQYSQNVVTATVTGNSGATVYAASTNSTMLIPFNISSDTPGAAITLPAVPNSIIADPSGSGVFLGSASGLMGVNTSGTVTTLAVNGTIMAISPNSKFMLLSDSVAGQLNYVDLSTGTVVATVPSTTVLSDAYTPDSGFNEWVTGTNPAVFGFGLSNAFSGTLMLANTANAIDIMAQGGLTYITSAAGHQILLYSTCNQTQNPQNPALTATSPTLIKAIPNGTGAVAVDAPNIDVVSTPSMLNAGCPITSLSTIATYDLGAGSFTAQQLIMSPDSSRAWIVSNLPQVVNFNLSSLTPTAVNLAGGATAFNGGITLDGAHVYVGASDNTVHRIDTSSMSDVAQVAVNLKNSSGAVVAPNLVCVLP